jgi:hypothetical protein
MKTDLQPFLFTWAFVKCIINPKGCKIYDYDSALNIFATILISSSNNDVLFNILFSCEIVALRKNFYWWTESYDLNRAKRCVYIVHKNMWAVLHYFLHFLSQSAKKNSIKNFSRPFSTTFISLLTSKIFLNCPDQLWKFKLLKCLSFKRNHSNFNTLNFGSWSGRFQIFLKLVKRWS